LKTKCLTLFFLAASICMTAPALANQYGVSLSGGYSPAEDVSFFRGAVKVSPNWKWFEERDWYLGLHFDLGFIFLNSNSDVVNVTDAPDSLEAISLTPVFRIQRTPYSNTVSPFLQAAVGASFFSEETLQNSEPIGLDFGGTFQFEDILSAGVQFGQQQQFELAINYFHYSNLNFYDQNDGIDIYSATFAYWF